MTMILSRAFSSLLTSPNLKIVVMRILRMSPRKKETSSSFVPALVRFGMSEALNVAVI